MQKLIKKKKMRTFICIMVIVLIFIVGFIYILQKDNLKISVQKETKLDNNCNHKPQLLYELENKKIYTYCIDGITITNNNKKISLEKYLKTDIKRIDKILKKLKLVDILKDGGTKIYKGELTIIKCNTLSLNHDIYIGNSKMQYKENFCKDNNKTFVKTYTIENIKKNDKQQYTEDNIPISYGNSFEVKIKDNKGTKDTVIINNLWDIELKKGNTYEFEFMFLEDERKEDNTNYIFKHASIVEIRKTNKKGMNQINESIY